MPWASNGTPDLLSKYCSHFLPTQTVNCTCRIRALFARERRTLLSSSRRHCWQSGRARIYVTMPRPNGFTHVKQQRTRCEDTEQSEQPARSGAATDGSTAPTEQQQLNIVPVAELPSRYSHAELAVLLWSTDYVGLLLHGNGCPGASIKRPVQV